MISDLQRIQTKGTNTNPLFGTRQRV